MFAKTPGRLLALSLQKVEMMLKYKPEYDAKTGFEKVAEWYYESLKS